MERRTMTVDKTDVTDRAYRQLMHEGLAVISRSLLSADERITVGDYDGARAIFASLAGAVQQQQALLTIAAALLENASAEETERE